MHVVNIKGNMVHIALKNSDAVTGSACFRDYRECNL